LNRLKSASLSSVSKRPLGNGKSIVMMSIEVIEEQSGTQMQLRRGEGRGRGIYGSTVRAAFCRGWRYSSENSGTGHPVEVVEVIFSCDLSGS
jgi:hypothetical protein